MIAIRPFRLAASIPTLLLALACRDEGKHVFQAPPPPSRAAAVATPATAVPEPPMGSFADARILSVLDAATGTPVVLTDISRPVDVMTVVARGPNRPAGESARVELLMRGSSDATQTLALPAPAPSLVAHAFTIPAADGRSALRTGRYTLQVRIIAGDGRVLATSVPLYVELKGPAGR